MNCEALHRLRRPGVQIVSLHILQAHSYPRKLALACVSISSSFRSCAAHLLTFAALKMASNTQFLMGLPNPFKNPAPSRLPGSHKDRVSTRPSASQKIPTSGRLAGKSHVSQKTRGSNKSMYLSLAHTLRQMLIDRQTSKSHEHLKASPRAPPHSHSSISYHWRRDNTFGVMQLKLIERSLQSVAVEVALQVSSASQLLDPGMEFPLCYMSAASLDSSAREWHTGNKPS